MRLLLFVTPRDFRDESVSRLRLFLDKWGVNSVVTSYSTKACTGSHGATLNPDINSGKVLAEDFDGIILVDGKGVDSYKIYDYRPLLDMMLIFNSRKKTIITVGNATKIVARANIIKEKKVAVSDDETKRLVQLFHGTPTDNALEISGNLMTIGASDRIDEAMPQILQTMGVM